MNGSGCTCYASSKWECCCDADWRDSRTVELEEALKRLYKAYQKLHKTSQGRLDDFDERFYFKPELKYVEELLK